MKYNKILIAHFHSANVYYWNSANPTATIARCCFVWRRRSIRRGGTEQIGHTYYIDIVVVVEAPPTSCLLGRVRVLSAFTPNMARDPNNAPTPRHKATHPPNKTPTQPGPS